MYSDITNIAILSSLLENQADAIKKFKNGFFNEDASWKSEIELHLSKEITTSINSPLRKRMSDISKGIFYVLDKSTEKTIKEDDEIYLFSGFSEINTTNDIIKSITVDKDTLVSPTHFHNSVHNTPLGYFTIIKGIHNYTTVISDGMLTNLSFINFMKNIVKLNREFIVSTGEEFSNFFLLDKTVEKQIVPVFAAFRVVPNSTKGFNYLGEYNSLEDIVSILEKSDYIFTDKDSFLTLSKRDNIKSRVYTEYPIVRDNPCGIIFRLLLPFYLSLNGKSTIIEQHEGILYLFEAAL